MNVWVCLASGSSLKQADIDYAKSKGAKIACTNDTWRLRQDAELMFASDNAWWSLHGEEVKDNFKGEMLTTSAPASVRHGIKRVNMVGGTIGLLKPPEIANNRISGARLINIVAHKKPDKIILLGYDMKKGRNGEVHYFGNHPSPLKNMPDIDQHLYVFDAIAEDATMPVINCSDNTAITSFPIMSLKEALL